MAGKQAKVLAPDQVETLLDYVSFTRWPTRNRLLVLLSVKAGLRACEITGLTWEMALDAGGQIGDVIELHDQVAKAGSGRLIPVHADLSAALQDWRKDSDGVGPVIRSERGGPMTAVSIVNWFAAAYR